MTSGSFRPLPPRSWNYTRPSLCSAGDWTQGIVLARQAYSTNWAAFCVVPIWWLFELFFYMSILWLSWDTPEEGIRSHYRWLWATMWLLGIELRTSGRAIGALNRWAISPALHFFFFRLAPTNLKLVLLSSLASQRAPEIQLFQPCVSGL
jgi:hypothetical protein